MSITHNPKVGALAEESDWLADHAIADATITEAKLLLADNTTANVSTTKHGLVPKAPNDATKFLNGTGAYTAPPGAAGGTPAVILGTAAAAGTAGTFLRDDDTIVAFDATVPVTQAFSDAAATGAATVASRRDHKHGMPATPTSPPVSAAALITAYNLFR